MRGLMMDTPLLITSIMQHADTNHGEREIVSITSDQPLHRYTLNDSFRRTRKLANALAKLGLDEGDRIATLAWNDYRHFELYYGVSCSGYVLHTINPRLFAEQLVYIINHAEDRLLFTDPAFLPLLEAVAPQIERIEHIVVLTDREHMPDCGLGNLVCYEEFIDPEPDTFDWPTLDENLASSLCYTSGTTGNPKGVLYSHRSTVLHAFCSVMPDTLNVSAKDVVLPVVPMFHVNAWGTAYAAPLVGAKLVFPGPKMADGATLHGLMEAEGVTAAMGVPTVWLALLNYLRQEGKTLSTLQRVVVGGAACPWSIMEEFEDKHGVYTHHAWGMTEMSPIGTFNMLKPGMEEWPRPELESKRLKQGRAVFGVEMKITDESGRALPWDGEAFGDLKVRGPWICSGYFRMQDSDVHDADGWFTTGDVATIDPDGFMQITDRTKDVIKSGGEWISSIDLENVAMLHPAVAEAAVIGLSHPKWTERPLLLVVRQPGQQVSEADILGHFEGKVASWWVPDDVEFVDELPHTATGKVSKLKLREQFSDYRFSDAVAGQNGQS